MKNRTKDSIPYIVTFSVDGDCWVNHSKFFKGEINFEKYFKDNKLYLFIPACMNIPNIYTTYIKKDIITDINFNIDDDKLMLINTDKYNSIETFNISSIPNDYIESTFLSQIEPEEYRKSIELKYQLEFLKEDDSNSCL